MPCDTTSINALAGQTLRALGTPPSLVNKLGDVYEALLDAQEHYSNILTTYGQNFILGRYNFTLPARAIEFTPTGLTDWGRPILCETDPAAWDLPFQYVRHEVNCTDIEDLDFFRREAPRQIESDTINGQLLASAMTWFRDTSGVLKFQFEFGGMLPQLAVPYRIYYQAAGLAEFDPTAAPKWLPNFFDLLKFRAARVLMPKTDYEEPKYGRYERTVSQELADKEKVFADYIRNANPQQSGRMAGWRRGHHGQRRMHR